MKTYANIEMYNKFNAHQHDHDKCMVEQIKIYIFKWETCIHGCERTKIMYTLHLKQEVIKHSIMITNPELGILS